MKGLLIKDFMLLKAQKNFFIVIVLVAAGFTCMRQDTAFVLGYLSFVMPMFALSTISYDEFDGGSAFLFALPISRKTYVVGKYIFGLLLGVISLGLALLLTILIDMLTGVSTVFQVLAAAPAVFGVMVVLLSVLLPLQIKFGAEKSRIAMIVVGGLIVALGVWIGKILERFDLQLLAMAEAWLTAHPVVAAVAGMVIITLVLLISYRTSSRILEKKEF